MLYIYIYMYIYTCIHMIERRKLLDIKMTIDTVVDEEAIISTSVLVVFT